MTPVSPSSCGHVPGHGLPQLYHKNGVFLIARVCLADEEPGSDITGSTGHVVDPYKSAVKHLALHKRGTASVEQAPATVTAFPWAREEQGGTRGEPAPTATEAIVTPRLSRQGRQRAACGDREDRAASALWDGDWGRGTLCWGGSSNSFWVASSRLPTLPLIRGARVTLCPRSHCSAAPSDPPCQG